MKATVTIEIEKFSIPKSVFLPGSGKGIELSGLDPETLERLCDQFRDDVFKAAGKERPRAEKECCIRIDQPIRMGDLITHDPYKDRQAL